MKNFSILVRTLSESVQGLTTLGVISEGSVIKFHFSESKDEYTLVVSFFDEKATEEQISMIRDCIQDSLGESYEVTNHSDSSFDVWDTFLSSQYFTIRSKQ